MTVFKLLISCCLLFASFFLVKLDWVNQIKFFQRESRVFAWAFFIFRILPFVLIYLVFQYEARSDVKMFYDSALKAFQGGFVYRDFPSAYSPLFPYLTAIPLFFVGSAKSILLEMILLEGLILWGSLMFFHHRDGKSLLLIYLLLPSSFVFSVLGGQEDLLMWGVVVAVLVIYQKNASFFWVGIGLGIGLLLTKFLLILIFPAIFIYTKSKGKFILGCLCIGIPSLLFLYSQIQWDFLSPIQQANDPRLPNFWSVLHVFTNGWSPLGPKWLNWVGLLAIITGSSAFAWRYRSLHFEYFLPNLFLVIFIGMMIVQQSSLANYAYNFMLPFMFVAYPDLNNKQKVFFAIFNIALVIQPPIWWGQQMKYLHHWSDLKIPVNLLEYSMEVIILLGLIYFLIDRLKKVHSFSLH
jgi:hypothetical protein